MNTPPAAAMTQSTTTRLRPPGALALLLGLAPLACSTPAAEAPSVCGEPDLTKGDPNVLVGSFIIELAEPVDPDPGKTLLVGKVYDGPTPAQIIWEPGTTDGACTLYTPRVPFCSTPCGGSAACVEDETCQDYPASGSAGTVTVTGLQTEDGRTELSVEPIANNYQTPTDVKLLYPAFEEGGEVCLDASGDKFGAFSLGARTIAPLALTSDAIALAADQPIALTWEPAADPKDSTIFVKLDISHHGGSKGKIECEGPDDGALELSGPLVTELLGLGVAGFPSIIVSRKSVGSTTIEQGRVDLTLVSSLERSVEIDGLNSCTSDTECPMGQTCQSDLTCQ